MAPLKDTLNITNDTATEDADAFNFRNYADALCSIINNPGNKTPFTIGINGKWGSGKTSLMKTMKKTLDTQSKGDETRSIKTVWFNAWKYTDTNMLLASLVREIYAEMEITEPVKYRILEIFEGVDRMQQITDLVKILTAGLGPDLTKWRRVPEYKQYLPFYNIFQDYLRLTLALFFPGKGPDGRDPHSALVIFIDDLDRCSPDGVATLLKTLNLFFDQEGCIFVIGMDSRYIASAISSHYRDYKGFPGENYLTKMIQVRFDLPEISDDDIETFISKDLKIDGPLAGCLTYIKKASAGNPRQCKQFVNSLRLMIALAADKKEIDTEQLAKWSALNALYPGFIDAVKGNLGLFLKFQEYARKKTEDANADLSGIQVPEKDKQVFDTYRNFDEIISILGTGRQYTEISTYVHLSSVVPTQKLKTVYEAIIDSDIFVNRIGAVKPVGGFRAGTPYTLLYHFQVLPDTPDYGVEFASRLYVDGKLAGSNKFYPHFFNGDSFGTYPYTFPHPGKYHITIQGLNSVEAAFEVE